MSNKKTILVTGGAGFIGSHVVDLLTAKGHTVRVLDDFSNSHSRNLSNAKCDIIEGNIENVLTVVKAAHDVDDIIHLAAKTSVPESIRHPIATYNTNVTGTLNVLEAARENNISGRVIYASSAAVYGTPKNRESLTEPEAVTADRTSPYAVHKYICEQMAAVYQKLYRVESVGLRFFNVYGPRQDPESPYAGVLSIFLENMFKRDTLTVYGDGEQARDFVYVADVADATVKALDAVKPDIYNVGTGRVTSLNTIIATLKEIFRYDPRINHQPERAGDVLFSCANTDKFTEQFKQPLNTQLTEGLKALYNARAARV